MTAHVFSARIIHREFMHRVACRMLKTSHKARKTLKTSSTFRGGAGCTAKTSVRDDLPRSHAKFEWWWNPSICSGCTANGSSKVFLCCLAKCVLPSMSSWFVAAELPNDRYCHRLLVDASAVVLYTEGTHKLRVREKLGTGGGVNCMLCQYLSVSINFKS